MFLYKMRFQITSDDETKEYDSFKEAAKDLNIESRTIHRFLNNGIGGGKFQRRSDKKVFWIESMDKNETPIIKIDGEDFSFIPQILKKFKLRQKNFVSQMAKNHFGFVDSGGLLHKVDWIHDILLNIIKSSKNRKATNDAIKLEEKIKQSVGGYKETLYSKH